MKSTVRRIRPVVPRFLKALAQSMSVYEGTKVEMEVEVRSQQSVAFEWERDGIAITQHTDRIFVTTGDTTSVLHITVTSLEDQGKYTCYAISDAGEKSTTTKLNVIRRDNYSLHCVTVYSFPDPHIIQFCDCSIAAMSVGDAEAVPFEEQNTQLVPEFAPAFTTDSTGN